MSSLPIVALLTFDEDAHTLGGVSAARAAAALEEQDVAAIGANHGLGLQAALRALEQMSASGKPLAALPNVGLASLAGQRGVFPHTTPEYFADFAAHAQELGARIIGGCCGTTPTQIAAIQDAVDPARGSLQRPSSSRESASSSMAAREPERETLLQRKLRAGEFVVSVGIDPPRGGQAQAMLDLARTLQESGHVDVVDVNDNPWLDTYERADGLGDDRARRRDRDDSPPDTAGLLDRRTRVDAARGARRRDPRGARGHGRSTRSWRLPRFRRCVRGRLDRPLRDHHAHERRRGLQRPRDRRTDVLSLGVAVNPAADDLDYELDRFEQKLEAGAKFAMTQVLFDFAYLDEFFARLGRPCPIPLLIGIFYVKSYQLALRLHNEVPGIVVPDHVQARLRDAGAECGGGGPGDRARAPRRVTTARRGRLRHPALQATPGRARALRLDEPLATARSRSASPPEPAPAGEHERLAHARGRNAEATPLTRPASEDRGSDAAVASIRDLPSYRPNHAPDRGHRLPHRTAPVRVSAQEVARLPEATGSPRQRPVLRIPDERHRDATLRIGEPQRPPFETRTRSSARSFFGSKTITVAGSDLPS